MCVRLHMQWRQSRYTFYMSRKTQVILYYLEFEDRIWVYYIMQGEAIFLPLPSQGQRISMIFSVLYIVEENTEVFKFSKQT